MRRIEHSVGGNSFAVRMPDRRMQRAAAGLARRGLDVSGRALVLAAEQSVSDAQDASPVDTGFLRESHFVRPEGDSAVLVGASAEYALPVESTVGWFRSTVTRVASGYYLKAARVAMRDAADSVRRRGGGAGGGT